MCGVNGIISTTKVDKMGLRLAAMNEAIAHRGPDADCQQIVSDGIGFGHRRLSIIDLDKRSQQPMISNSGGTVVVFNGEIFNYQEIKKDIKDGYHFRTESDTEVLLAAFELKGMDWLVRNISGMFAFALFDKNDNILYLVRDRFGIKPLYYSIVNNILVFSSEVKGILRSGLVEAEINYNALDEYLGNRYVREPFTFFKNIFQVESSTYLKFGLTTSFKKIHYWELPNLNFDQHYNEKDIIDETDSRVKAAVNKWLIADVKVGAYLSGGLDSSLTTALLATLNKNELDTYTIGFNEKGFNEFYFAREVAKKYKTNHREFIMDDEDYFNEWTSLIGYKDAPLAVPNEIPLAVMSSGLSKDITVVISGEGADELFGGYGRIYRSAFDYMNHGTHNKSFYDYFIQKYEYVPRYIRDQYLSINNNYRDYFDEKNIADFKMYRNEENIFRFFHKYHITGLLNRVDMTTMQTGVEARPPFLDHELVEYVYKRVPYNLKLKWISEIAKENAKQLTAGIYSEQLDIPKYALKKVAEKYLPREIIYRKKMGFPVPLTQWYSGLQSIANRELKDADWLKTGAVTSLSENIKDSTNDRSGQLLWMFCNIELFKKKYFSKTWKW